MGNDKTGCNPEEHREHICELERDGEWETLACVTRNPTVYCDNCKAEAISDKHVCEPRPLNRHL